MALKDGTKAFVAAAGEVKIDSKTGVASFDEALITTTLPEGIDIEHVKKYNEHITTALAGMGEAMRKPGVEAFSENQKLKTITGVVTGPVGDQFEVSIRPVHHLKANGESTTEFGQVTASYTFNSQGESSGDLKKVSDLMAQSFKARYEKLNPPAEEAKEEK